MAEELDQRRGADDKAEAKPGARSDHKHVFDSTVDNPQDPPSPRKYCACGHWEVVKK